MGWRPSRSVERISRFDSLSHSEKERSPSRSVANWRGGCRRHKVSSPAYPEPGSEPDGGMSSFNACPRANRNSNRGEDTGRSPSDRDRTRHLIWPEMPDRQLSGRSSSGKVAKSPLLPGFHGLTARSSSSTISFANSMMASSRSSSSISNSFIKTV